MTSYHSAVDLADRIARNYDTFCGYDARSAMVFDTLARAVDHIRKETAVCGITFSGTLSLRLTGCQRVPVLLTVGLDGDTITCTERIDRSEEGAQL